MTVIHVQNHPFVHVSSAASAAAASTDPTTATRAAPRRSPAATWTTIHAA